MRFFSFFLPFLVNAKRVDECVDSTRYQMAATAGNVFAYVPCFVLFCFVWISVEFRAH